MSSDREHLEEILDAANEHDLRALFPAIARARAHVALTEPDADTASRAAYAAGAASTASVPSP